MLTEGKAFQLRFHIPVFNITYCESYTLWFSLKGEKPYKQCQSSIVTQAAHKRLADSSYASLFFLT